MVSAFRNESFSVISVKQKPWLTSEANKHVALFHRTEGYGKQMHLTLVLGTIYIYSMESYSKPVSHYIATRLSEVY